MTVRVPGDRARPVHAWVRRARAERTPRVVRQRAGPNATPAREVVAWILSLTIAAGSVAYAYRPWPALWCLVAAVGAALAIWLPDVLMRHAWRPITTVTATLAWLIVSYGAIACANPMLRFDERAARLVPAAHAEFLPSAVEASNAVPTLAAIAAALAALVMATDLGKSARLRRRFCAAIAAGGFVTAAVGAGEQLPQLESLRRWDAASPWFDGRPFGLLSYHNHAATMINLAMPAFAIVCLDAGRRRRALATIGVLALAMAALANVSRTGLTIGAALSAASIGMLWLPRGRPDGVGRARRWLVPMAAGGLVVALIAAVLFAARPSVLSRFAQVASDDRFAGYFPRTLHWQAGVELFHRSPAFGLGPGGYRLLMLTTSTKGYYLGRQLTPGAPFNASANSMNDYVQTLAEWGVVGSAIWATLLFGAAWQACQAFRMPPVGTSRREIVLVVLAASAIFVHSLIDPPLQAPLFQLIAALLVGMLWSARRWRGRPGGSIASFFESSPSVVTSRVDV